MRKPIPKASIPADIITCFKHVTKFPMTEKLTMKEASGLILTLRRSELIKTSCGRRLIAWYMKL